MDVDTIKQWEELSEMFDKLIMEMRSFENKLDLLEKTVDNHIKAQKEE